MSDVAIVAPSILPPTIFVAVSLLVLIESALTVPDKVSAVTDMALNGARTNDDRVLSIIFDLGEESRAES